MDIAAVANYTGPVLRRRIVSMPDNKSFISFGLASARQQINNFMLDVIINIGLILQTLGTRDNDLWYYTLEQDSLTLEERDHEYFVFKLTKTDDSKIKIFQVKVGDHGLNLETFQRGNWEKTLAAIAENIRIADKGREEARDKEEEEQGD